MEKSRDNQKTPPIFKIRILSKRHRQKGFWAIKKPVSAKDAGF